MKKRLTWLLLLIFGFLILLLNKNLMKEDIGRFINEFKELLKKNSKYIEDSDYILTRKNDKKN